MKGCSFILTSMLLCLSACNKQPTPPPSAVTPHAHAPQQQHSVDAKPATPADDAGLKDATAKDYRVDNTVSDCADVAVQTVAVGSHHWEVSLSVGIQKNIGSCGCVSALLRYRVLSGGGSSLAQLATGTINSFRHTSKSFVARHQVSKADAPFVVQLACNGG